MFTSSLANLIASDISIQVNSCFPPDACALCCSTLFRSNLLQTYVVLVKLKTVHTSNADNHIELSSECLCVLTLSLVSGYKKGIISAGISKYSSSKLTSFHSKNLIL